MHSRTILDCFLSDLLYFNIVLGRQVSFGKKKKKREMHIVEVFVEFVMHVTYVYG